MTQTVVVPLLQEQTDMQSCVVVPFLYSTSNILVVNCTQWLCTIEIASVDEGCPDPGSNKQEIFANHAWAQDLTQLTQAFQSCTATAVMTMSNYQIKADLGLS